MSENKPPTNEQAKSINGLSGDMHEMMIQLKRKMAEFEGLEKTLKGLTPMLNPVKEKRILINGDEIIATLMKNGIVSLKFKNEKDALLYFDTHK